MLAVLPHVLWEEAEEAGQLEEWVEANALPRGTQAARIPLSSIQTGQGRWWRQTATAMRMISTQSRRMQRRSLWLRLRQHQRCEHTCSPSTRA